MLKIRDTGPMRYKPGQRVKIKRRIYNSLEHQQFIEQNDYILTIEHFMVQEEGELEYYKVEGFDGRFTHTCFEGLYIEPQIPEELICSRFEILDL